jgi:phosphate uptake regulator
MAGKQLSDMTDAELFVECSVHLSRMCDRIKNIHEGMADIFRDRPGDDMARAMLEFSMRTCLEALGDLLNGIDAVKEEDAEDSAEVFEELHRRYPSQVAS